MNLAAIIDPHPAEAPALVGPDRSLSYGQLRDLTASARHGLSAAGVGREDRVAIALGNHWAFVVVYLATLGLGAVAVPVDPSLPLPALEEELGAVGPVAALVTTTGTAGAGGVGAARRVLTELDALVSGPAAPAVDLAPGELAVLIFTAGTAGAPRAAMLSHGNLLANLEQVQHHPGRAVLPGDVSYGVLPLFHVFGLNVVLGLTLMAGGSVLLADRFEADRALEEIPRHRVSLLAGAPPMFAALAAAGTGDELAGVRLAVSGASALPPEVGEEFTERFGLPLWQGYGLTEAAPVVTSSVIGGVAKPGSIGVPIPGVDVTLIDESGETALVGDPGEIWVRGPNVFAGYWRDPEATTAVLTADGWLRTGDVAVADDDGYLYLVDRKKDIVIVSGFNVYPAEVEAVLAAHPGVAEVAVVGTPEPATGEALSAYVVARPGATVTDEELMRHCRGRLARYKCPSRVVLVEALPRGVAGKLLRRSLRRPG
ncbi:MAG TPA: AMP-binding protein [Acidimicrobiales bacterium]|nr:AMP-binding protein [Acidimicrobiales bacterium]